MAKEILAIPEENLFEVITVIRAGLNRVFVSRETRELLLQWCNEEAKYIKED